MMKFHEAVRLGSTLAAKGKGSYFPTPDTACAIGAGLLALGISYNNSGIDIITKTIKEKFPWLKSPCTPEMESAFSARFPRIYYRSTDENPCSNQAVVFVTNDRTDVDREELANLIQPFEDQWWAERDAALVESASVAQAECSLETQVESILSKVVA